MSLDEQTPAATRQSTVRHAHVLVPLDGTERSTIALRSGLALAARLGAEVHTVGVASDDAARRVLHSAAAAALGVAPDDPRVHTLVADDAVQAIASLADELGSCVVCMSTHAHGRVTGAALGSTARALLQVRDEPILMIGPQADRPVYLRPTWAAPLAVDRLVVCIDLGRSPVRTDDADRTDGAGDDTAAIAAASPIATLVVPINRSPRHAAGEHPDERGGR